jgi:hypothetical protein
MAHTTGIATDYIDLLDRLRLYVIAQGWQAVEWTPGTVAGGDSLLRLVGPGAGAGRPVVVSIQTVADVPQSRYSWTLRASTAHVAGAAPGTMPGETATPSFLNLWENAIPYWFFVNDRRIVVIARCSTFYMSAYAGMFLPWATPPQYPFPLYVGADYPVQQLWSYNDSGRRMMCDPGGTAVSPSAQVRTPEGSWIPVINHDFGASNDNVSGLGAGDTGFVWPWHVGDHSSLDALGTWGGINSGQAGGGALDRFVPTRQGERWVWPATIMRRNGTPLGALDGVFCAPGAGLVTEQTITAGARNLMLFQNIQRASGNDFLAMEQL